ncbi:MAG: 16S rRNA (guanine(966)-N(2))-methyltransferase RsmD [Bacilli bacterium]|nr:16S rRNA (guanine(966)-N(2))-methyltransferase RsmD [Bacilli bacterium]
MIRITGGKHRSRKLVTPETTLTKPTMDKVRAGVFNALNNYLEGKEVLDLFAGSGSYGFEAISRGANFVTFVDQTKFSKDAVTSNANILKETNYEFVFSDALSYLYETNKQFDLIFMDPPYKLDIIEKVIEVIEKRQLLKSGGAIIVESEHEISFNGNYVDIRHYSYGLAHVYILRN